MSKMSRPTNHMRTTEVGAFPLPSVARISPLPLHPIRTCDDPRQTAMKHDLDHFDRTSPAWCTNKLPDCGARADRSITGRTFDGRSGRTAGDGRSSEELLAERTTNSGERANVSESATATIFPSALFASDHWREHRDIVLGLIRQRSTGRQMVLVASRPCIVGGKESRSAVAVVESRGCTRRRPEYCRADRRDRCRDHSERATRSMSLA